MKKKQRAGVQEKKKKKSTTDLSLTLSLPALSHRRSHSQARRKFGLLEKKTDYKARSDDFHKKEEAIARLRAKADGRNPDEFSFGMVKAKTAGGVPVADGATPTFTADELALMRTQDTRYVAMVAGVEAKKLERLRSALHGLGAADAVRSGGGRHGGGGAPPSHTVFVDTPADAARFNPARYFDTPPALLARAHNRPRSGQVGASGAVVVSGSGRPAAPAPHDRAAMKADKQRAASYKELSQRGRRLASLRRLEERLRLQTLLQGKGGRRKLAGASMRGDPAVHKWKRVRTK